MKPSLFLTRGELFTTLQSVGFIFSACITLSTLGWVLWRCHFGFDFTDEGYYLVAMATPWLYKATATQFGFAYHPLYELLHGNIAELRQANILATFGLAFALCYLFLERSTSGAENSGVWRIHRAIAAGALALSSLSILIEAGFWLVTPSYDSLNFQALIIVAVGFLLLEKEKSLTRLIGYVLLGIGGWVALMAKPTTAALLSVDVCIALWISGRWNATLVASMATTIFMLFVTTAWYSDGSIPAFIERLIRGAQIALNSPDHAAAHLLRIDNVDLTLGDKYAIAASVTILATVIVLGNLKLSYARAAAYFISLICISLGTVVGRRGIIEHFEFSYHQSVLYFSVPVAVLLACAILTRSRMFTNLSRMDLGIITLFAMLPYTFAFGTSNNYWMLEYCAVLFWILLSLTFLYAHTVKSDFAHTSLPICFAVQLLTIALITLGMNYPYRSLQPLHSDKYESTIGRAGSTVYVPDSYGEYMQKAAQITQQAGFSHGTPMIDMTGQSPGLLYSIGASNVGQAWMIGGGADSDSRAITTLKLAPCEQVAQAWLLMEPGGPKSLSTAILRQVGIDPATDYLKVGDITAPRGAGGYSFSRAQQILKPARSPSAATSACKNVGS